MNIYKAWVFILHFFFFIATAVLFVLKFHERMKLKVIIYATCILWIIFGTVDFIFGAINISRMFKMFKIDDEKDYIFI